MRLLPANHSSKKFHEIARQYPNRLGWLLGPGSWKTPREGLFYALDNDAFIAWKNGTRFNEAAWLKMLDKIPNQRPDWALVPDVVANRVATLESWERYFPEVKARGLNPAFALQDGMTQKDVPLDAKVVFVGGTTEWKWRTLPYWCHHFPRVHVGRTNGIRRLWIAQRLGAESCDGTGYFRATFNGLEGRKLQAWLHHGNDPQLELTSINGSFT